MTAKKIYCPNGHLVGVREASVAIMTKRGRTIRVSPLDGRTEINIICERCGEAVTVRLGGAAK